MPALTLQGGTQCDIRITARQSNPPVFAGVAGTIEEWTTAKGGETVNHHGLTDIHLAALSFDQSDIYHIHKNGAVIYELCKEYLLSDEIASRAIVAYPVDEAGNTQLDNGCLLQLSDMPEVNAGGKISWDTERNSFTYTPGNYPRINAFYINSEGQLSLEKPVSPLSVYLSSYRIEEIRNTERQTYPVVKIGTQYWMKENLHASFYRDGTPVARQSVLDGTPGYFRPEDGQAYFYNGEALQESLSPEQWKIPSESDWSKLQAYVRDDASLLKSGNWTPSDKGNTKPATNRTGFNASPVGMWYKSGYGESGNIVGYWAADDRTVPVKTFMLAGFRDTLTPSDAVTTGEKFYKAVCVRCLRK
jgi:uncharacterized protein (TIGR02145 family)